MMRVHSFTGPGFAENAYLAVCPETGRSLVIDPGSGAPALLQRMRDEEVEVEAVVLTHAHLDHVEGVPPVVEETGVDVHLHARDRPLYQAAPEQARAFGVHLGDLPTPAGELVHGQEIRFGECRLEVRHAPGHSPGHVILVAPDEGLAFVGDVVFQGSIGRTDLPGGDFQTLMRSIRQEVLSLPDETRLLPGHGLETRVEAERTGNPFLIPHYGGDLA